MELEVGYIIQSRCMWSEAEIMVRTYFAFSISHKEQYFQEIVVTCTTLLNTYQKF